MLSISIQHDATILPKLCQCFCRLLSICIKITANAKPAIFPSHEGSSGSHDKSRALFIDPVGSITSAARRHGERLRFTRPECWHVDRWRGCLSAAVCYRHLIAIDPPCCTINCKSSLNHKLHTTHVVLEN